MAYVINGTIEGIAPILFNRMIIEGLEGPHKGTITTEMSKDESALKVHRDGAGYLCMPGWNLKQCLLQGVKAAGIKRGRASAAPRIAAVCFFEHAMPFAGNLDEPDSTHETWGRRPPRTGGACIVRRPMLNIGWRLPFVLNVLDDSQRPEEVRRALEQAGVLVGLGSWRPEYGRFIVDPKWSVKEA